MAKEQCEDNALFHVERIAQYVSLSPSALATPLPAICALVLSPLLLSWFAPARGVVLAYEDVELSATVPEAHRKAHQGSNSKAKSSRASPQESAEPSEPLLLRHVNEYCAPFLWATASFVVWRPQRNAHLTGVVTHQSKTHITLQHLNVFPVSIVREHLPPEWTWYSEEANKMKKGWDGRIADMGGWWINGEGVRMRRGTELRVRIRDWDGRMDEKSAGKAFIRIEGSLLSVEEEKERAEQKCRKDREGVTTLVSNMKKTKTNGRTNEEAMEVD